MIKLSLRTKILLSVGLIIFVVLGTSTVVHIQDLKQNYLEALEWRSEALAQGILSKTLHRQQVDAFDIKNVQLLLESLSQECVELYDLHKGKNVTHFAIINASEVIAVHNDVHFQDTPIENPVLRDQLQRRELTTVLDGTTYHTLIPMFGVEDAYLGTIDIGVSREVVDEKVRQSFIQAAVLFVLFLILAFFTVSLLVHFLITKPLRRLVEAGQQLAEGKLIRTLQTTTSQGDEIALLGTVFSRISVYLQNITEVASHVATGILAEEVHVRSKHDILGKAVQKMLHYLKHVSTVMARIAEGDLTDTVQVRSTTDAFGRAIQMMTEGLHTLIVQIRASAEQITSTGKTISSLAARDCDIVQSVQTSAGNMVSTMKEMGTSVEEVALYMDILSTSVEETSASVSQMTTSIAHIATNTLELTQQTHQTIESLDNAVGSLERTGENTDESKRLAQRTIQDALEGQQAVEQVMTSMEMIQQTVTTAVEAITGFAQRSREIDTILDVIRDITEQTSLLALNASIIAAQAGTHGRGFAVVADEIKNLADGVSTSTKDIGTIVRSLQQDTNRVVQSVHEGVTDVKQGMERTQQAQEALEKIISSAQRSSSVVTEIADALHGLITTSHNVSSAMEQVNAMTDHITAATEQQKASTVQINTAVAHITDMTSQIQQATTEQLTSVHQLLDTTNNVTSLIDQNLESSQQIARTTEELSSQADILLQSVVRFKLNA
jgi:methyl-accepting chemotaxis protein